MPARGLAGASHATREGQRSDRRVPADSPVEPVLPSVPAIHGHQLAAAATLAFASPPFPRPAVPSRGASSATIRRPSGYGGRSTVATASN